jgi:hypothetical protein
VDEAVDNDFHVVEVVAVGVMAEEELGEVLVLVFCLVGSGDYAADLAMDCLVLGDVSVGLLGD